MIPRKATSYGVGQYYAAEAHEAILPKAWHADQSKRCVVYCHGADGNAVAWRTFAPELPAFAHAGVPVISCDLTGSPGGAQAWGNDSSQARVTDAWTYAKSAFGVKTDKMILWGSSMGGLTSLNYLRDHLSDVAAWGGAVPVIDIDDVHDNDRGSAGYAANIETAYGGLAAYNAAEVAHNPSKHAADYVGVPMKIWAGDSDPICIYSITQTFATATGATLETISGTHSAALLDPDMPEEAATFVAAYA